MDRGAWWAAVHGVAKSQTRLSNFTFTFHFHALEKEMAAHSSVLAWRIPGTGSLVGCHLWGRTESGTTEATWQQQVYKCHTVVTVHISLAKACYMAKLKKMGQKKMPILVRATYCKVN